MLRLDLIGLSVSCLNVCCMDSATLIMKDNKFGLSGRGGDQELFVLNGFG